MKSLTPWPRGDKYLRHFFDEDSFSRFEDMSLTFPKLDMEDRGNIILVVADVPGVEQKDVHVEAEESRLIIKGKTEVKKEEKKKEFYRRERKSGSFYREIPLPCRIDPRKVSAKFKNGTLEIILPKKKGAEEKVVKISIQ